MRFLLKVNIPVEAGNAAAKAGKLGATIQSILADLKPETVYFTDDNGQRTGFIFLDMQDASQIPAIAEPWFLAFNASLEIHPVMIPEKKWWTDGRTAALFMREYSKLILAWVRTGLFPGTRTSRLANSGGV